MDTVRDPKLKICNPHEAHILPMWRRNNDVASPAVAGLMLAVYQSSRDGCCDSDGAALVMTSTPSCMLLLPLSKNQKHRAHPKALKPKFQPLTIKSGEVFAAMDL